MVVKGKHHGYAYFDLPINAKRVNCYTVKHICDRVHIPTPDHVMTEITTKDIEGNKPTK